VDLVTLVYSEDPFYRMSNACSVNRRGSIFAEILSSKLFTRPHTPVQNDGNRMEHRSAEEEMLRVFEVLNKNENILKIDKI
jgi:hypothetical protein